MGNKCSSLLTLAMSLKWKEREWERSREDIIKEIIKEKFPPHLQLNTPAQFKNKTKKDPRYISMKTHNARIKEKISKSSRKKNEITS